MLLAEQCLSTERCFLLECDRGGEKGFFSERALRVSCKHTHWERLLSLAMLIWSARDLPQTPWSLLALALALCAVSSCLQRPGSFVFSFLVHWVNLRVLYSPSLLVTQTETWICCSLLKSPYFVWLSGTSDTYNYQTGSLRRVRDFIVTRQSPFTTLLLSVLEMKQRNWSLQNLRDMLIGFLAEC